MYLGPLVTGQVLDPSPQTSHPRKERGGGGGGDYNLHHVCAYVRECVTQFSLKLLQLHIFGKLLVLMKFYALQYFLVW